ncbi:MAG: DedA family protein [Myxococcota bacterium]
MQFLHWFLDVFVHLDVHLTEWSTMLGPWLYALLFGVVFAETGLVVTPFLPGDSLLFAVGALAALPGVPLEVSTVILTLIAAAVLGDAVNYTIGSKIGAKVFNRQDSWFFKKEHLIRTHAFYEKHGGKTIIIARFMPIVRTFAPFVAGIGSMTYRRFFVYNVVGAVLWVTCLTLLGFWFGNMPMVKKNFQLVLLGIVFLSILPGIVEYLRHKLRARAEAKTAAAKVPSSD